MNTLDTTVGLRHRGGIRRNIHSTSTTDITSLAQTQQESASFSAPLEHDSVGAETDNSFVGTAGAEPMNMRNNLAMRIGINVNEQLIQDSITGSDNHTVAARIFPRHSVQRQHSSNSQQYGRHNFVRAGHVYVALSALVALLAVVTPPSSRGINKYGATTVINTQHNTDSRKIFTNAESEGYSELQISALSSRGKVSLSSEKRSESEPKIKGKGQVSQYRKVSGGKDKLAPMTTIGGIVNSKVDISQDRDAVEKEPFNLFKPLQSLLQQWYSDHAKSLSDLKGKAAPIDQQRTPAFFFRKDSNDGADSKLKEENNRGDKKSSRNNEMEHRFLKVIRSIFDVTLTDEAGSHSGLKVPSSTATEVMDKILTSTPRLLALANLLLAVTYLLHSAVADLFLGNEGVGDDANTSARILSVGPGFGASTSNRMHRSGRERLGGYLLFKLLLISAVVEPDTLDMLILLSWYTLLSFLRSLAHLAAMSIAHASASGQPPQKGVLKLLLTVLFSDLTAAAVCAALFHGAGWGMVLLLNCDCALLAVDIFAHLTRYGQQVIEQMHNSRVTEIENMQLSLNNQIRSVRHRGIDFDDSQNLQHPTLDDSVEAANGQVVDAERFRMQETTSLREQSRLLDQQLEVLEAKHRSRLGFLNSIVFAFEMLTLILTIVHFLHIWSLHGVTFNLVDGVLALHLHSAITAVSKKISERRNLNRIARDLDGLFEDASDVEMRKAVIAGDVCCICLGTMSTGNVKKVGCGHLYHTMCLREVVERARCIESARCPLCRASILDGRPPYIATSANDGITGQRFGTTPTANEVNVVARLRADELSPTNAVAEGSQQAPGTQGENSLFRFSTEGLLPVWLPLPAFSFEVVRRPTPTPEAIVDNGVQPNATQDFAHVGHGILNQQPQQHAAIPFWRRLLLLSGIVQMSADEEAGAIAQLVDMFPQYDRVDLLRELRNHSSAEAVVEIILSGHFLGVERQGAVLQTNDVGRRPSELNRIGDM